MAMNERIPTPGAQSMHAFSDDLLGERDAVELSALLRRRELGAQEVLEATRRRLAQVAALNAVAADYSAAPRSTALADAPFAGVPTFVKDNVEVAGMPTRHGSVAMQAKVAGRDDLVTKLLLDQGFVVLGKSRMPEFGFSPTTEFQGADPTRNPWHLEYSSGGSSGGAAALVASGVVPIAHGNDGGGSIRIPAANTGLVGLKPTRGRLPNHAASARLPLKIITDGVLTRTVRDSAHFLAACEARWASRLPRIGLVEGPSSKRLRIGLVLDSVHVSSCPQTRAAVERTAQLLEKLGHTIIPMKAPVPAFFVEDFKLYWGFLAYTLSAAGRRMVDPSFEPSKLDGLSLGLASYFRKRMALLPLALLRLGASKLFYAQQFRRLDAVLSPVTAHVVPRLGELNPALGFEELFERILRYTAFTPINNATGGPGIAVPAGVCSRGLPIGAHFSAAHGQERTLLELAYLLESERGLSRCRS